MGQQRGQRVSLWRQVLHAGCWWLLSLSRMVLRGLWWLWRLAWCLLICYKSCWDHIFQATEEVMAPLCPPHPLGALESSEPREGVLVGGPAVPKGLWVPSAWHSPGTPLPGTPQAGAAVAVSVLGVSGGFQLSTDLGVRLERGREGSEEEEEEEEDGDSMNALDAGQAGGSLARGNGVSLCPRVPVLGTLVGAEPWWQGRGAVGRLYWGDWRHWKPMYDTSAPSWELRNCCGAAASWSSCRSSRACARGCRNARGDGTEGTAPSCWGTQRSKVGARERAQGCPRTLSPQPPCHPGEVAGRRGWGQAPTASRDPSSQAPDVPIQHPPAPGN
ncbi:uncharacterized protein [Heliangelus exortis]